MSFFYLLKEGIAGFRRARLATVGSILTITLSLLLVGLFYIISVNISQIGKSISARIEMEAFLEEPILNQRIVKELQNKILSMEGVDKVRFVSKEEAAKIFQREFGEDINKVLDFNPLPPSLIITLKDEYRTIEKADTIQKQIETLRGVEKVIYKRELLDFIEKQTKLISNISLGLGILLGISAIFFVSNTIRLTIYAKRKSIQTMKLIGASPCFIRTPFIIEGVVQGIIGGVIAVAVIMYLVSFAIELVSQDVMVFMKIYPTFYIILISIGILLGFFGSIISIRRFIGEKVGE